MILSSQKHATQYRKLLTKFGLKVTAGLNSAVESIESAEWHFISTINCIRRIKKTNFNNQAYAGLSATWKSLPHLTVVQSIRPLPLHIHRLTYRKLWPQAKCCAPVDFIIYVKSFSSLKAHLVALISVSLALSQTPVYTARPRIRGQCIARCACLRPSFCRYSLRLPTEGWPGWVDLGV